jgi:hypothetical protein
VTPKFLGASCVSQLSFLSIRAESEVEDMTQSAVFDQESSTLAASFSSNTFAGYNYCATKFELEPSQSSCCGDSTVVTKSDPMRVLKRHESNSDVSSLSAAQSCSNTELASDRSWLKSKVHAAPPRLPSRRGGVNFGTTPDRAPPRQPSRTWDDDAGQRF